MLVRTLRWINRNWMILCVWISEIFNKNGKMNRKRDMRLHRYIRKKWTHAWILKVTFFDIWTCVCVCVCTYVYVEFPYINVCINEKKRVNFTIYTRKMCVRTYVCTYTYTQVSYVFHRKMNEWIFVSTKIRETDEMTKQCYETSCVCVREMTNMHVWRCSMFSYLMLVV